MSDTVAPVVLAVSTAKSIGAVIAVLVVIGFLVYAIVNVRAGRSEVGSEIELAPNRQPYLDDDALETTKLGQAQRLAFVMLTIIGLGLPLYWLNEPGRQSGAIADFESTFVHRGEELFVTGSQCQNCHGPEGVGGVAPYTILDKDGKFVAQVSWLAPALNTVLMRYSRDEVEFIINFGRPFSPMPAWGIPGGGPLNEQQVKNLIDYLASIQITPDESREQVEVQLRKQLGLPAGATINYNDPKVGQALFNLGRSPAFAGGAYACGRCHTRGWSISRESVQPAGANVSEYLDYPDGSGAFGPRLRGGVIPRQFATVEDMVEFVSIGGEQGKQYGRNGQSSQGMMPGFGDNPNTDAKDDGMLTQEMIEAIVNYEAGLNDQPVTTATTPTASTTPTTTGAAR